MEMLGIIFTTSLCWALVNCRQWTSLPSVTFSVEHDNRLEDLTVESTVHFSAEKKALRVDLDRDTNFVIIDLVKSKGHYYYHAKNVTGCWTVEADVQTVLPTVDGMNNKGKELFYETPAERYERSNIMRQETLWVLANDTDTGLKNRPIRHVVTDREFRAIGGPPWTSFNGIQLRHEVTNYFRFAAGEPPSSIWNRPAAECRPASDEDAHTIKNVISDLTGIQFNEWSDGGFVEKTEKKYATGWKRRSDEGINPADRIKLKFPYSEEQIAAISKTLPKSFDWGALGAVTPVKNQLNCGSGWAFGTVGAVEGAFFRKGEGHVAFSEQALVDCAGTEPTADDSGANGCYGGDPTDGYLWMHETGGIPPAGNYHSYQELNGKCLVANNTPLLAQLKGFYKIPNNTAAVKVALVELGPLAVAVDGRQLKALTPVASIISGSDCNTVSTNHIVLLVGYGESDLYGPYWIVKNSWGASWGVLGGYIWLSAEGNCLGILDYVTFPVLRGFPY